MGPYLAPGLEQSPRSVRAAALTRCDAQRARRQRACSSVRVAGPNGVDRSPMCGMFPQAAWRRARGQSLAPAERQPLPLTAFCLELVVVWIGNLTLTLHWYKLLDELQCDSHQLGLPPSNAWPDWPCGAASSTGSKLWWVPQQQLHAARSCQGCTAATCTLNDGPTDLTCKTMRETICDTAVPSASHGRNACMPACECRSHGCRVQVVGAQREAHMDWRIWATPGAGAGSAPGPGAIPSMDYHHAGVPPPVLPHEVRAKPRWLYGCICSKR